MSEKIETKKKIDIVQFLLSNALIILIISLAVDFGISYKTFEENSEEENEDLSYLFLTV